MSKSKKSLGTIAVSRTDAIGDVVMTLPMCGIIKQNFPDSKIIFIGNAYTLPILQTCSDIDEIINIDNISSSEENTVKALKSYNIDAIVFAFPNKYLAKASKKANIPVRIGTSHRIYNLLYCNYPVNFSRKNSDLNEAQLNIKLLKPLIRKKEYTLSELTDYVHIKDSVFYNAEGNSGFSVIIHPKSKKSAREWPVKHYQKLVDLLDKRIKVFVCGTEKEGKEGKLQGENVTNLFGKFSLSEYISFIANCQVLVACSTGPLHIAGIMGIDSVGLFPPMRPIDPKRWRPLGKKVKIFCHNNENCRQCKKDNTPCYCMGKINPQDVARYINSLYANSVSHR